MHPSYQMKINPLLATILISHCGVRNVYILYYVTPARTTRVSNGIATYISRKLGLELDLDANGEGGNIGILLLPVPPNGYDVFFSWLVLVFCFFLPSSSALLALLFFRFFDILLLPLLLLFVSLLEAVFVLFTATSFFSLFFEADGIGGDFHISFGDGVSVTAALFFGNTGFETPLLTACPLLPVSALGIVCWNGK